MKKSTSAEKRGERKQNSSSFRESSRVPRKVGRPPLYETPEKLEKAIAEYFAKRDAQAEKYGLIDAIYHKEELTIFLGFSDRKALDEYRQKPEFSPTIKKAELKIEMSKLRALPNRKYSTDGIKFDLKCNYGYQDTQNVVIGSEDNEPVNLIINFVKPEPQE